MSNVTVIARAVAWNAVTGVGARIVGLAGTLILAHFISPDDYGQVSAASICVLTATMFANLQLGQFLIARGYRHGGLAFHAALVHIAMGWTAIAAVLVFGRELAAAVGAPGMTAFLPGFALASTMDVVGTVPEKTLARDMRFRLIAGTRGIGEVVYTGLALATAPALGGMAIVVGNIGRSVLHMTVFIATADRGWMKPCSLAWSTLAPMLKYSVPLAVKGLSDFASGRWDNLLIGRLHGSGVMGAYNLAYNLGLSSTIAIAEHIGDVLFPSFSRLDRKHRGPALVRAVSAMTLVGFPFAAGLAVAAPSVVGTFLPDKWALIAPMLTVLSPQAAAAPLGWTLRAFLKAEERTTFVMVTGPIKLVVLLGGIATLGQFGPLWACVAVDLAFILSIAMLWSGMRRDYGPWIYPSVRGVTQSLLACVPLVACVLLVKGLVSHWGPLPPAWSLCLEVAAGALGYAIGAALFARATSTDLLRLAASVVRRRNPQSSAKDAGGPTD